MAVFPTSDAIMMMPPRMTERPLTTFRRIAFHHFMPAGPTSTKKSASSWASSCAGSGVNARLDVREPVRGVRAGLWGVRYPSGYPSFTPGNAALGIPLLNVQAASGVVATSLNGHETAHERGARPEPERSIELGRTSKSRARAERHAAGPRAADGAEVDTWLVYAVSRVQRVRRPVYTCCDA